MVTGRGGVVVACSNVQFSIRLEFLSSLFWNDNEVSEKRSDCGLFWGFISTFVWESDVGLHHEVITVIEGQIIIDPVLLFNDSVVIFVWMWFVCIYCPGIHLFDVTKPRKIVGVRLWAGFILILSEYESVTCAPHYFDFERYCYMYCHWLFLGERMARLR